MNSDDEGESVLTQLIQLLTPPPHTESQSVVLQHHQQHQQQHHLTHCDSSSVQDIVPTPDSSTHEYMSNFNLKASASNTFDKVKSALKATRFLPLRCILSTNISLNLLCPRHILYFLLSLVTVWLQNI